MALHLRVILKPRADQIDEGMSHHMLRRLAKIAATAIACLAMLGGETLSDEPIPESSSPEVGLPAPAKLKPGKLRRDSSGNIVLEPESTDAGEVLSSDSAPRDPTHAETRDSTVSDRPKPASDQKFDTLADMNVETPPPG